MASQVDVATDNDIILKVACYGLTRTIWPDLGITYRVGVLGAARYVLSQAIDRASLSRDKREVHAEVASLLGAATVLEPTHVELELAAELETIAQQQALHIDAGESLLAAITAKRAIPSLQTGDKRAIGSFEQLVDEAEALSPLVGRVRCLEQLLVPLVEGGLISDFASAICAEPNVDKALSICFACASGGSSSEKEVLEGLMSYINEVRSGAPRVLSP